MSDSFLLSVAAILALVPAMVVSLRKAQSRDGIYWLLMAVAVAGPLLKVGILFQAGWRTGISSTFWGGIAASIVIFAIVAAMTRRAWRLTPLLLPYLVLLGVLATIWQDYPGRAMESAPSTWIQIHIGLSVVTYGLLTVAAVAGLAVFVQERALKSKSPGALGGVLPSMADSEGLQVRLLVASGIILACGLITGMSAQYVQDGRLMNVDHKTILSLVTFAIIGALLIAHYRTGIRGRRAARVVLLAYLCLTLAYPGVKFVTDVVLA